MSEIVDHNQVHQALLQAIAATTDGVLNHEIYRAFVVRYGDDAAMAQSLNFLGEAGYVKINKNATMVALGTQRFLSPGAITLTAKGLAWTHCALDQSEPMALTIRVPAGVVRHLGLRVNHLDLSAAEKTALLQRLEAQGAEAILRQGFEAALEDGPALSAILRLI